MDEKDFADRPLFSMVGIKLETCALLRYVVVVLVIEGSGLLYV